MTDKKIIEADEESAYDLVKNGQYAKFRRKFPGRKFSEFKRAVFKESRIDHRDNGAAGYIHPDHAKYCKVGQHNDFYAKKTGDKEYGKCIKNDGKEVHMVHGGKTHVFKVGVAPQLAESNEIQIKGGRPYVSAFAVIDRARKLAKADDSYHDKKKTKLHVTADHMARAKADLLRPHGLAETYNKYAHDSVGGRRISLTDTLKTSKYTVATNAKDGHKEQRVTVDATSENHARNLGGEHFISKGLKPRVHFDGVRVVKESTEQLVEGVGIGDLVKFKKHNDIVKNGGHKYGHVTGFVLDKKDGKIHPNGMVSGTVTHYKMKLKKDPLHTVNHNPEVHIPIDAVHKVNQADEIDYHKRHQEMMKRAGIKTEGVEKQHSVWVSYHKKSDPDRKFEARFKTTHSGDKAETEKRAKAAFAAKGKVAYSFVHEEALSEEKHRFRVTLSDPHHTAASKRSEKIQKFMRVPGEYSEHVAYRAVGDYYKKKGYKVHEVEHIGMVESTELGVKIDESEGVVNEGRVKWNVKFSDGKGKPAEVDRSKWKVKYDDKNVGQRLSPDKRTNKAPTPVKESEQIEELSSDTLKSYSAAAKADASKLTAQGAKAKKVETSYAKFKKATKRFDGAAKADKKSFAADWKKRIGA